MFKIRIKAGRHCIRKVQPPQPIEHICQAQFLGVGDVREAYIRLNMLAGSRRADCFLIRSHMAYWMGARSAEVAVIKAAPGTSYRIECQGRKWAVYISDCYDHRNGIVGLVNRQ